MQTIARGVFEVIVDQSPLAPEETLGEEKMEVGDTAPSEGELPEDDTAGTGLSRLLRLQNFRVGFSVWNSWHGLAPVGAPSGVPWCLNTPGAGSSLPLWVHSATPARTHRSQLTF